jgi:hypothetical protein
MEKGDGYSGPHEEPEERKVLYYIFPDHKSGLTQEIGRAYSDKGLAEEIARLIKEGNTAESLVIYNLFDDLVADVSVSVSLDFPNRGERVEGCTF